MKEDTIKIYEQLSEQNRSPYAYILAPKLIEVHDIMKEDNKNKPLLEKFDPYLLKILNNSTN